MRSCSLCESKDDDCHSDTGGDEMSEIWDCFFFFFSFFFFFLQPTRHWNCFHYYSQPSASPGHYRHQLQFSLSLYLSLMILVHLVVLKLKRLLLGKSWVRGFSPLAGVAKRLARYHHSLKLCVEWFLVRGLNFWLVHVTAMTRLGSSSPPLLSSLKALTRAAPVSLVVFVLALSEVSLIVGQAWWEPTNHGESYFFACQF